MCIPCLAFLCILYAFHMCNTTVFLPYVLHLYYMCIIGVLYMEYKRICYICKTCKIATHVSHVYYTCNTDVTDLLQGQMLCYTDTSIHGNRHVESESVFVS